MCLSLISLDMYVYGMYAYMYILYTGCIKLVPLKFGVSERFTTVKRIEDTEKSL